VAKSVVNSPKQTFSVFANTQSNEIKSCIFDEFNSLSGVYQKVTNLLASFPMALMKQIIFEFGLISSILHHF